ncbi:MULTISPECIES: ABC transporter ATP-binding protein [unclassified Curtobacterium]|uniref:ABC transporter ATP-binding protein n=1 Tax=unclassified Curtobacterium TaxID=257496 RepID=UPI000DA8DE2F|nr:MULTISPECIES: ABC transporter ATP-binding protein [unclassified Curtobacterium]PZE23587.1 ABC transporter ATP-binding protein [Curtobacterium sp. MCBD17_028]PZE73469.1 ABC transporter ATP-binding protein [Curtobacterium sp. MCBD17_019]PZF60772.1 ABC transporter ATP-binding protein [Curtobacterium sp. MCBD17_013]WIE53967.1 ABC transporter ATP-binding protein [Curtobacterium sp. MCBD17_003]
MSDTEPLLSVRDLRVVFPGTAEGNAAVAGIDFDLFPGQTLGLVGESGSGKSTVCLAILGLLPRGTRVTGQILFRGRDLVTLGDRAMRPIRGREIGLVYQDPLGALNPTRTIGSQLRESLRLHLGLSGAAADDRAVDLLERVGIQSARAKLTAYPHEFSGGMRQRVVIAMAISCNPVLLLADEPTTALDVSVQAQVLELLQDLSAELGLALMLVSHDLSVVAGLSDVTAVMRYGEIVEQGEVDDVFSRPQHPYTRALLDTVRALEREDA